MEQSGAGSQTLQKAKPSRWAAARRVLVRWLLILSGLYLALLGLLYLLQSRLIFFPTRELETDPGREGMAFEDVELVAADGVRLHGWWVPAAGKSRGALVFCHGNAGNISHRLDSLRIFRRLGLDTLIFDYRGYGRSGGGISEAGLYLDARAAWEHVVAVRKVPPERIVVFGRSLGGAVASRLAAEAAPRALILESAFASVPDMAAAHYPWLPARALCRYRLATVEHVAGVRCPLLVVHSPDDKAVPYSQGRRVYEAAPGPKAFLEIRGGHNDGFLLSGEDYVRGLAAFLDRELPAAGSGPGGGAAPLPAGPRPGPGDGGALPRPAARDWRTVHVFVPLCDNRNQGIVKVPAALGDGQSPDSNLYWGARYGLRTFLSRSAHWKRLAAARPAGRAEVLERAAFRHAPAGGKPVYLVADAYDGARMREALAGFLAAAAGRGGEALELDGRKLALGGGADLVAFCGHNGLLDLSLEEPPRRGPGAAGPAGALVLACKSRGYFAEPLAAAGCRALLLTTDFMAPEAYTLDAAVRAWAAGAGPEAVRRAAAAAYAEYQKCSAPAAARLFAAE